MTLNDILFCRRFVLKLSRRIMAVTCLAAVPATVCAQSSPWATDYTTERASVSNGGFSGPWQVDRVDVSWTRPEQGGWLASAERQMRYGMTDLALGTRGYRRLGDWTVAGGVAATPQAEFLYRAAADASVSRRVVGTFVATAAYQSLWFPTTRIHQVQPAVTWYHPRGEVEARVFITNNVTANRTTTTTLLRTVYAVNPRLQLSGGASYGSRIFDVAALPTDRGTSRVGFAHARIGITRRDFIEAGVTFGDERPAFSYQSFTLGYRRTF